ncbi:hypothetical protein L6164_029426 [Bauhinia variegata]|uniref:Uncharacterized protein n=1 Tax=Bauhinia variegata TaxID=167791 RepID=A0ACB9L9S1_BAUVA|nr:hypothetical protein L6164_029426 [Bauhinia variegata]
MGILKATFTIAIAMALSIAIIMKTSIGQEEAKPKPGFVHKDSSSSQKKCQYVNDIDHENKIMFPSKRVSRFLAEKERNPRAADHCRKDNEICYLLEGTNSTCCNNKCMDLGYDKKNCGGCKNKCKFNQACCRGQCVGLAYDKRHCGACNHRCEPGEYCVYGMCNYA